MEGGKLIQSVEPAPTQMGRRLCAVIWAEGKEAFLRSRTLRVVWLLDFWISGINNGIDGELQRITNISNASLLKWARSAPTASQSRFSLSVRPICWASRCSRTAHDADFAAYSVHSVECSPGPGATSTIITMLPCSKVQFWKKGGAVVETWGGRPAGELRIRAWPSRAK